uniref:Uncharacterized protein n=1 Tax=Lygus hesperus TaxID=30085 RepID=A0A0K8S7Q9_LYGHE
MKEINLGPKTNEKKKLPELKYGKSKHQEKKEQWTENLEERTQKTLDFLTGVTEVGAVVATVSKTAVTLGTNPYLIIGYAAVTVSCLLVNTFAEDIVDFLVDGSVSGLLDPCDCFEEHYTRCYEDEEYRKEYSECCFQCTGDMRMVPDKLEPKIPAR